MIYALILLIAQLPHLSRPELQAHTLIQKLASPLFAERIRADKELRKFDVSIISVLRKNEDHPDPEVKYRVRSMLDDLRRVRSTSGFHPIIWSMPNRIRYQPGYETDIAKQLYLRVYEQYFFEKNPELAAFGDLVRIRENYRSIQVANDATYLFVAELRESGMSIAQVRDILDEMEENERTGHHTRFEFDLTFSFDTSMIPPSPVLSSPVIEGQARCYLPHLEP